MMIYFTESPIDISSFQQSEPAEAEVLFCRLNRQIDAEFLDGFPQLKVVATPCTGTDHIDLAECERRGIEVISLRNDLEFLKTVPATSELTLCLMLCLLRRVPLALHYVRRGGWNRDLFRGRDLASMVVGIVGMGRIGTQVSHLCRAFGATVTENHTLADLVSVHVQLGASTSGLCDAKFFAEMKPGSYFVNTSRGEVVDETALLDALESGHIAGAALDVVCNERGTRSARLLEFANAHPDRLLITPHIGGNSWPSCERAEQRIAEKLMAWADCQKKVVTTS